MDCRFNCGQQFKDYESRNLHELRAHHKHETVSTFII